MALQKREKLLAMATGLLLALFVIWRLLAMWSSPGSSLGPLRNKLAKEIETMTAQVDRGREAEKQLAQWRERSLPANLETARSLYQNWLLSAANGAGFAGTRVEAGQGRRRGDAYHVLRFNLQAQASLDEVARFLRAFYAAGYLHQLQSLDLQPIESGRTLDVRATVEALTLPGAVAADRLPEPAASPALAADLERWSRTVVERNLFASYTPPPAPPPSAPPAAPPRFDAGKFIYLTAVVRVADQPEAWLVSRTSGEQKHLRTGDSFDLNGIQGTIVRIDVPRSEVEVEMDDARWRFRLGNNIREMVKLSE